MDLNFSWGGWDGEERRDGFRSYLGSGGVEVRKKEECGSIFSFLVWEFG